ncbi:MAG: dipeptidase PepV [Traorella sp.]
MDFKLEAKKYEEQFKKDLKELVKIPSLRDESTKSENAPFGKACREVLDKMMEIGSKAGFHVKDVDGYACVIEYGEGDESIGILAHLDVVPIGDDWEHDPLSCEEVDGFMFGRGVLDDKGPLVAGLTAMRILKDHNIKLNKKIQLICGCDEESGMQCMEYYCKHEKLPVVSFTPDANFPVIYGEKGIMSLLLTMKNNSNILSMNAGERMNVVIGKADAKVKNFSYDKEFEFYLKSNGLTGYAKKNGDETYLHIDGVSAHASMPWFGVNAGLHLLNFIGCAYHDDDLACLAQMLMDVRGYKTQIGFEGAYMGPLTSNAGIIRIDEENIQIVLDIRYPNDTTAKDVIEGMNQAMKKANLKVKVENPSNSEPLFLNPNSEFIKTLMNVYREYSKDNFTPAMTMGGGTYARKLPNCVAFGPEFPNPTPTALNIGGPHQANEAICIDDMMTSVAIYAAALEALGK